MLHKRRRVAGRRGRVGDWEIFGERGKGSGGRAGGRVGIGERQNLGRRAGSIGERQQFGRRAGSIGERQNFGRDWLAEGLPRIHRIAGGPSLYVAGVLGHFLCKLQTKQRYIKAYVASAGSM